MWSNKIVLEGILEHLRNLQKVEVHLKIIFQHLFYFFFYDNSFWLTIILQRVKRKKEEVHWTFQVKPLKNLFINLFKTTSESTKKKLWNQSSQFPSILLFIRSCPRSTLTHSQKKFLLLKFHSFIIWVFEDMRSKNRE